MLSIYQLPVTSTELTLEPIFEMMLGRDCSLTYSFEVSGKLSRERLIFSGTEAFRCTYFAAVDPDIIDVAYDKVIDLDETDWLTTIRRGLREAAQSANDLRHLVIYFDDGPAYEFVCREFRNERLEVDGWETVVRSKTGGD